MKPKLLVVCGPTATGKSDLAVILAKTLNGEVISADSRQVYRGLDIGSGKITTLEMEGITHHMLDMADVDPGISVVEYKDAAQKSIMDICARGKLPILCGGTGLYVSAVVDNRTFPRVPPDHELRTELEHLPLAELQTRLQNLDPERFETIEKENPIRLIRAIEIATALGYVPKEEPSQSLYDVVIIGLELPKEELVARIQKRLDVRLAEGMVEEVERLHADGLSWERLENLGLEYRYIARYLQKKISYEEMKELIATKSWQYARRQMTWFKRDTRIQWFHPNQKGDILSFVQKELLTL